MSLTWAEELATPRKVHVVYSAEQAAAQGTSEKNKDGLLGLEEEFPVLSEA